MTEAEFKQYLVTEINQMENDKLKSIQEIKDKLFYDDLFNYLQENTEQWYPEGIVDIKLTDEKLGGYATYQHCRVVDDENDNRLYMQHIDTVYDDSEIEKTVEYWVYQTTGYLCDDYSGFMLFPMKNGKYFRISYTC